VRAWYFNSSIDCRRPYLPLKPITASASRAISEKARAQNQGESLIGAGDVAAIYFATEVTESTE
jgi:hypothetical protein